MSGAGREKKAIRLDPAAGIILERKTGACARSDVIATPLTGDESHL